MKKLLSIILCGLIAGGALMSLAACGTKNVPEVTEPELPNTDIPYYKDDTNDTPDISVPVEVNDDLQKKVNNHISDFSVEMFKQSVDTDKEGNTLVSPISVYTLLSLLANGADFTTKTEIIDTLSGYYQKDKDIVECYGDYNPLTVEEMNAYFDNYINTLKDTKDSKIAMANSVWVNKDSNVEFNDNFLSIGQNYYHAEMFNRSFDDKALKELNSWVDKETDGMIDKILDEIPEKSVMFLVNALTFDSKWANPYEENQIIDDMEFNNYDGSKTKTQFLYSVESKYLSSEKASGFIKYYEDYDYSFVALLPDEDISIDEYIENIFSPKTFSEAIETSLNEDVQVHMPKFEAETDLDLKDILSNLGIREAFNPIGANFSNLAITDNPAGNIYIGEALHKTFIKLDENGTKAAAATLFGMIENDVVALTEIHYVTLDRPFVYAIYDNNAQIPIFIGTVKNL